MFLNNRDREWSLLHFVELDLFTRSRAGVISDKDLSKAEEELRKNPYAGDLVAGTKGVRKIRVGVEGKGKRGGSRVLYYYMHARRTVYYFFAYAKSDTSDLSPAGKQRLNQMVDVVRAEKE